VFAAGWEAGDLEGAGTDPLVRPRALAPEALVQALGETGRRVLAVGDGALAYRTVIEGGGAHIPQDESALHRVSAAEICRLALAQPAGVADDIRPDYLREPDAERRRVQAR
jgi:tRNA A37 threonylcarbamoyladenosine modification protein TsaB